MDALSRYGRPPADLLGLCSSPSGGNEPWRERSEHWLSFDCPPPARKLRERSTHTLVLCGHGIALRVEAGTLFVRNGFTHHPQQQETHRYFRGDLNRPARIIVLDGSGHLTFDVLDWLAEQDMPLIRVAWTGDVVTVAGGSGYSAERKKVEWQRAMRADSRGRATFGAELIAHKIENSIAGLWELIPASAARDRAVTVAEGALVKLRDTPPTTISELHGIEGPAAASYFEAWQDLPIRWMSTKRRPVPDEWRTIGPRASMRAGKKTKNRNATHPVNAMLNYAYAVAVGEMKMRALSQGYDPTIGIMHQGCSDGPAYALDLVEPVRPLVDRAVLGFIQRHELHRADFVIRADGACRLNPQLAKYVVQLAQNILGIRH